MPKVFSAERVTPSMLSGPNPGAETPGESRRQRLETSSRIAKALGDTKTESRNLKDLAAMRDINLPATKKLASRPVARSVGSKR